MRIVLLCILFFSNPSFSQPQATESAAPISADVYQEKKKALEYDKTKKGLSLRDRFKPKIEEEEEIKPRRRSIGFGGLELLAYVAIGLLIIGILYLIFDNVKIDKKIKVEEEEDEEIENIEDIDADAIYKKAIAEGNYKLAIRMQFIKILQILTQKDIIEWKNEKTNRDYIREITDGSLKRDFRTNSNYYEKAWYGDEEVNFGAFRVIDQKLTDFINKIT